MNACTTHTPAVQGDSALELQTDRVGALQIPPWTLQLITAALLRAVQGFGTNSGSHIGLTSTAKLKPFSHW